MTSALGRLLALAVMGSTAVAAANAPSSRQAAYDAAQAAFDKQDWPAAAAGFGALLPADPSRPLGRSEAIIAARLATALDALGRYEQAGDMAARASAALKPGDSGLIEARLAAAEAARFQYDPVAAAQAFADAARLAAAAGDTSSADFARVGAAAVNITVDPSRAAADLDAYFATPAAAALPKRELAVLEDSRALAAINAGNKDEAHKWIDRALDHSGATLLSDKVSGLDASLRGDAAIIARLRGDDETARKFLTFSGAGHMEHSDWINDRTGDLPLCGVDGDVRPQDSAVVQFSIADDGSVARATPIYASRPGEIGFTFAHAVSAWHWSPAAIRGVSPFWRSTLRLELRCVSRPQPLALGKRFLLETVRWLYGQSLIDAEATEKIDHDQADAPDGGSPLIRTLFASDGKAGAEHLTSEHAWAELDRRNAPAAAYALLMAHAAKQGKASGAGLRQARAHYAAMLAPLVPQLVARFPNEPATLWLELDRALALEDSGQSEQAMPLIDTVLAAPVTSLPADDPIRRVALLHKALIKARAGDLAAANEAIAASGLTADQCALFDTHPVPKNTGIADSMFPDAAQRWHFEGTVEEAFDINANGSVSNVRTVLAYPPFIFGATTELAVRSFRFLPPTIDGKVAGCSGEIQTVNYRLP